MKTELQQRIAVLHRVVQGQLTPAAAAQVLGLSERQVRRLLARYRDGGAAAVQHGNRGRQPAHTIRPEVRQRVVALAQSTYQGYNDYQLSTLLAEREGLSLSRSSVRRILQSAGLLTSQPSGRA
jgi:transposase